MLIEFYCTICLIIVLLTHSLSGGLQIYDPYGWAVVASIARKNPYLVETLKHTDIIDLKALKQNMKITNVKKNEDGEKVKWNNEGSITWMRFEKISPDTIK